MSPLKGALIIIGLVTFCVVGTACIAVSGVVMYNKHLENMAAFTKEVAINSQPCTLPTSTNNEVQIDE